MARTLMMKMNQLPIAIVASTVLLLQREFVYLTLCLLSTLTDCFSPIAPGIHAKIRILHISFWTT
jgi:hypothetical protein